MSAYVTIEIECIDCGGLLTGVLRGDHVDEVCCRMCQARLDAAEARAEDLAHERAACRAHHPASRGAS